MEKLNSLKKKKQPFLLKEDCKAFQKLCSKLAEIDWSPCIEFDAELGWVILAVKKFTEFGTVLKRVIPFRLNSLSDFNKAVKHQERFRKHLAEVIPYKIFLGNKIHLPTLNDNLNFLSEANFEEWRKYFKR